MCELSRSLSNIEDTLYEVKSDVRDMPCDTSSYSRLDIESDIRNLSKKIDILAEITLKLSGVDTYKMTNTDLRKRIRKDVDELSANFNLYIN
tara:strand:- start:1212 stop:1487 length:276 start_codon:yes stop_codon:yes gene_type:complete